VDFQTDRKGLLWILDEESVFPGASDSSFLDRLHMYHGGGSTERGDAPLVKVIKEDNQFIIDHCQRRLPVLYDANEWLRKAREPPSFRVVVQTLSNSKRLGGRGWGCDKNARITISVRLQYPSFCQCCHIGTTATHHTIARTRDLVGGKTSSNMHIHTRAKGVLFVCIG